MPNFNLKSFEVDKTNLTKTRMMTVNIEDKLAENEILFEIEKFALTANNISYGIGGELLGYWRFFPAENNWGKLPAMGYARVIASNCSEIAVGERVWGFVPMASHLKILAGKVTPSGFIDISAHRAGLSPVYAAFDRVSANPLYRADLEDHEMLLRGLFTTSWLVDDFMFDNNYFDAKQYLITSASSKTSIALGFAVRERNERKSIGITSEKNREFTESLGCYDQVVSYEEISSLDPSVTSIVVDMAGSNQVLTNIHYHFNQQLRYSCRIGATHHNELFIDGNLPGAKPIFFFAPTHIQKRSKDWGRGEVLKRIGTSLLRFMEFGDSVLTISHHFGTSSINDVYQTVLSGKADASVGHILSLWDE